MVNLGRKGHRGHEVSQDCHLRLEGRDHLDQRDHVENQDHLDHRAQGVNLALQERREYEGRGESPVRRDLPEKWDHQDNEDSLELEVNQDFLENLDNQVQEENPVQEVYPAFLDQQGQQVQQAQEEIWVHKGLVVNQDPGEKQDYLVHRVNKDLLD